MNNPLALVSIDDLVDEILRRSSVALVVLRQDEKRDGDGVPVFYYSADAGIYDAFGLAHFAVLALETAFDSKILDDPE